MISTDPARNPCTHAVQLTLITEQVDFARFGLGRNERVAVQLPNGSESAVGIMAVLNYCTYAPLNPVGTAAEIAAELRGVYLRMICVR